MKDTEKDTKIKVEHGIPIPTGANKTYLVESKALSLCKVGDSFLCSVRNRSSLYGLARYRNMRIAIRKEGDGLRIWRVK